MADTKITALAAIATVDPAADVLPIVDISDTSMAASGTTKKVTTNQILGASGTATLASATITGAATVGTTLGVTGVSTLASATITGLATVGTTFAVGTATPDIFARFYTRSIGFDSSGSTILQINGTSYGGVDLGAAGVRTFSMTSSATDANISTATNIPINFNINGATKMTLNTAGNLAFITGKGIDFSATASGSGTMTSELLNDYEEGTFTIALTFGGGSTGMTTSFSTGQYTKIGRQVSVNGVLVLTAKGSSTGAAVFSGLPFANANSLDALSAVSLRVSNISYVGSIQSLKLMNTSTFNIEQLTEAGSNTALSDANFSNSSDIAFNFTYNAA